MQYRSQSPLSCFSYVKRNVNDNLGVTVGLKLNPRSLLVYNDRWQLHENQRFFVETSFLKDVCDTFYFVFYPADCSFGVLRSKLINAIVFHRLVVVVEVAHNICVRANYEFGRWQGL